MAVKIIKNEADGYQVMYCSTTMQAFGPVLSDDDLDMEDFLNWLPQDARRYDQRELDSRFYEWLKQQENENA